MSDLKDVFFVENIVKVNKKVANILLGATLIVPTSFNIGDIEISIFTGGKSPLMARQLRKKIQSIITEEDILEIELQDYARNKLKGIVQDQKDRRKCLYEIFEDPLLYY